jgi:uncharacterized SAM-binding protein YcdF (DUF218 family)
MFIFLSKLLPLFFYPLGFSCILLIVALFLMWKRPRLAAIPISLALVILLLSSSAWVSDWLVRSLEFQHLPSGELPKAEAIVVLGGATESQVPPRPWVELRDEGDRVLYAGKLYREGKAPRLILSGGRIEWNRGGNPESADMAMLLETMGVPKSAVLEDPNSLNTHENAINVKLGMNAIAAPTDFTTLHLDRPDANGSAALNILNTLPDAEQLKRTTRALKEYVGIAVYWLRGWV